MRQPLAALRAGLGLLAFALTTQCGPAKGAHEDVGGAQYEALETAAVTSPEESATMRSTHVLKTAFVIVMENKNWSRLRASPSAPYLNGVLLESGAVADNYRDNPRKAHPSEPNYIWMEAGDNLAILDNDDPVDNYRTTTKHLVSLLATAGVPWKSYQQGISGTVCPIVQEGAYAPKHNPMVFFSDVTEGNNPRSSYCISHVRPEAELAGDLAADRVSGYVFITPDLCHDMHDTCASGDAIKNGDDFLAAEIPLLQASKAYQDGGAIFVTWDEGDGGDEPIGMVVLSPYAKVGFHSSTPFNHSSLLRSLQEIFAVEPLLRDAASATSLRELFTTYP